MRREAQTRFRWCRRQQLKSADGETLQPISVSSTLPQIAPTPVVQLASSARARGRSRVRRDRSKAYRRIASLETELQETKRLYESYRKRCQRLQKSKPDNDAENEQQVNATLSWCCVTKGCLQMLSERFSFTTHLLLPCRNDRTLQRRTKTNSLYQKSLPARS